MAIVFSLLGPSLKSIMSLSESSHCLNNLKQMGVGAALYASDYEDFIPTCYMDVKKGGWGPMPLWNDKLSLYLGHENELKPNLRFQLYDCPSLDFEAPSNARRIDYGWNSLGWRIGPKPENYGLGHWVDPDLWVPGGGAVKISDIATPDKMLMVADRAQYPNGRGWNLLGRVGGGATDKNLDFLVSMLHSAGSNFVSVDGHAENATHYFLTSIESKPLWTRGDD